MLPFAIREWRMIAEKIRSEIRIGGLDGFELDCCRGAACCALDGTSVLAKTTNATAAAQCNRLGGGRSKQRPYNNPIRKVRVRGKIICIGSRAAGSTNAKAKSKDSAEGAASRAP